jgi:TFIIF-interacting CTD phosphatase-like protein
MARAIFWTLFYSLLVHCYALPGQYISRPSSDDSIQQDLDGPLLPPLSYKGKKTLVLDLDNTLIHSQVEIVSRQEPCLTLKKKGDLLPDHKIFLHEPISPFLAPNYAPEEYFYVYARPHLQEFFAAIDPLFEVVLFTSAEQIVSNA